MKEIKYQQKNIPPIILSFPQLFVTLHSSTANGCKQFILRYVSLSAGWWYDF